MTLHIACHIFNLRGENPLETHVFEAFEKKANSSLCLYHFLMETGPLLPLSQETYSRMLVKHGLLVGGQWKFTGKQTKMLSIERISPKTGDIAWCWHHFTRGCLHKISLDCKSAVRSFQFNLISCNFAVLQCSDGCY